MGAVLPVIGLIGTIVSGVFSVVAPIMQAKSEAKYAKANAENQARIAEYNAEVTRRNAQMQADAQRANAELLRKEGDNLAVAASIEAERERRKNRRMRAEERAGAAESGMLSGTSLDLLDANSVAREVDALTIAYRGNLDAKSRYRAADLREAGAADHEVMGALNASQYTMQADYSRASGANKAKQIKAGGYASAIGGAFSSFGDVYSAVDGLNF